MVDDTAGTYAFFSPEHFIPATANNPKILHAKRCDIWAAGVTIFMIAAERHPFDDSKSIIHLGQSIINDEVDYSVFG